MTVHVLGIDIAKSVFQLHGADTAGRAVLRKRLPRHKLAAYIANLPACTMKREQGGRPDDDCCPAYPPWVQKERHKAKYSPILRG